MSQRKHIVFFAVGAILIFATCAAAQSNEELKEQVSVLTARVRQLEDQLINLHSRVSEFHEKTTNTYGKFQEGIQNSLQDFSLQLQANLDEQVRAMGYRVVALDIVSKEYRKIDTNSGYFLIAIKKVHPSAFGGYRLTVNIGNPNLASYSGVKLDFRWGENFAGGAQTYEQWRAGLTSAKYSYNVKIPPGSWIEFFVDIPAQSTKELAYIECMMDVETIELNVKNPL